MPSFINKLMLTEVKAVADKAPSMILVDASRLKSADNLKLRRDLRGIGANLKVAKVAIIQRAVPESAAKICAGARSAIGLVVAEDMVAAAKVIAELAKEDKVTVKGALMDGQALDAKQVHAISQLPGKQQLRGMLVNILAAPLTGFVRVLAEIEKKRGEPSQGAA